LVSTHKKTSMIHKMLDKEQEYWTFIILYTLLLMKLRGHAIYLQLGVKWGNNIVMNTFENILYNNDNYFAHKTASVV
jgi:hypothetical protein